jgi:methylenetetrahydrofolate reductase (NADPH)
MRVEKKGNSTSQLSRLLASDQFVVAAELSPPRGVDVESISHEANMLKDFIDVANVTDNQGASVRMASIPVSSILVNHGLEPVAQMTCRDRNRLAIQADLMGASALGIKNLLCLGGDHGRWGDHPGAKSVFEIDSTHLIRIANNLVENGCLDNGRLISQKPDFFIGAVSNPFSPPYDYRPFRLAKKVAAGALFIQTQLVFNIARFRTYMDHVRNLGLHEKVYILAGVGPLKSSRMAQFMAKNIPGLDVPAEIVTRMEKTPKAAQPEEGIQICTEIIEQIKNISGISGIHIMAVNWSESVPEIVKRVGLYPRPNHITTLK